MKKIKASQIINMKLPVTVKMIVNDKPAEMVTFNVVTSLNGVKSLYGKSEHSNKVAVHDLDQEFFVIEE